MGTKRLKFNLNEFDSISHKKAQSTWYVVKVSSSYSCTKQYLYDFTYILFDKIAINYNVHMLEITSTSRHVRGDN